MRIRLATVSIRMTGLFSRVRKFMFGARQSDWARTDRPLRIDENGRKLG
jgi:hypothetical protein